MYFGFATPAALKSRTSIGAAMAVVVTKITMTKTKTTI